MISVISNHNLSMESNENVLKRNSTHSSNTSSMKVLGKNTNKRDDGIRPTILAKPAKHLDDSINNRDLDYDDYPRLGTTTTTTLTVNTTRAQFKLQQINGYKSTQTTINQNDRILKSTQQPTLSINSSTNSLSQLSNASTPITINPTVTVLTPQQQQQQQQQQNALLIPLNQRLSIGPYLAQSIKVLDENFIWHEQFQEYLLEQTDFLVVGVIGKQGVGKSTLMSLLAGNKLTDENKNMIFKPTFVDQRESTHIKTNAVQGFVTSERTILLDVQPLLSSSLLLKSIITEKKHPTHDFKYYENLIELQSIELLCFLLAACHVLLVCEDWFTDPNLFRLIQTAEMLMPNMHQPGNPDEYIEHHPHMVYVLNKCDYRSKQDIDNMKKCIDVFMKDSKLFYKGSLCELRNHLNHKNRKIIDNNVNFVVIPKADDYKHDWHHGSFNEFNGMSSFDRSIKHLQRELLGIKRVNFTSNNVFTEKKWFAYASKVWESIKKSTMIGEYNRLMT